MPDYQKMYHCLFNNVTDAIGKLQKAQQKTEEMYINSKEPPLTVLRQSIDENKQDGQPNNRSKKNPPSHDDR